MRRHVLLSAAIALVLIACGGGTAATTAGPDGPNPTVGTTDAGSTTTEPPVATSTTEADVDLLAQGKSLAARNGCVACHSPDGSPLVGPTWQGLYGTTETLDDGSTVLVDDDYLEESIVDPDAQIVDSYVGGIMPKDFGAKLSDDDIVSIIAYIKSLK